MISLGMPLALVAGGLLASGVLALHLLAPRPPDRAPLPTARFLRAEAHTTLRFRRRPTDVPVMAARILLALLLGLLFAQPRWLPERDVGLTRIVLLDGGAGMSDTWDTAVEAALTAAQGENNARDTRVVTYAAAGLPATVVTGADTSGLRATRPADRESSYLAALRALRVTMADISTQEVEAVLVTRPRWSAWDDQFAGLRDAAWPGSLRVIAVGGPASEAQDDVTQTAAPPSPQPDDPRVAAALAALGYSFGDAARPTRDGDAGVLRFVSLEADLEIALEYARAGDTVVVHGAGDAAEPFDIASLWDAGAWPDHGNPSEVRVASRVVAVHDAAFASGRAVARGDSVELLPIVLDDGAPLASGRRTGSGCVVRFGASIEAGSSDPAYPYLLGALRDGCRSLSQGSSAAALRPPAVMALDSAALRVLEGTGSSQVAVATVGGGLGAELGLSLTRWVLLATVALALFETWLVWRRGQRHEAGIQTAAVA